ncbi:uncharacterized protein FFUJ_03920 [Fusarium fujikuroi IMI 58289]|uniref:Uncharacterized protein n=1 Tax=Gibberella fujikuroi (strain CBS 195.34 / IMI 58289 / NRRL A-6831) TaxID=1279085 RepID=S0DQG7_GIBF5|nr:uncharacterized protein FFUJ_03920 [Fusarium fujikuroi IMI 58289]CCT64824.1 uncharacterized protein FFUJ_03920 [Fusarium fujikuroi IMI 58289]
MFKKARRLGSQLAGWKYLIRAQQYTYHPMLVKLKFEREALAKALHRNEAMSTMDKGDQAATDQLTKWKTRLEQDENWPYLVGRKSSRTIYFLQIIVVALRNRFDLELQLEYNGQLGPIDRHFVIKTAFEAKPSQVMLATRATGGQGLNLQCFNGAVQREPWYETCRHVLKGPELLQS